MLLVRGRASRTLASTRNSRTAHGRRRAPLDRATSGRSRSRRGLYAESVEPHEELARRDDEPVGLVLVRALTTMHDAVAKRAEPAHTWS